MSRDISSSAVHVFRFLMEEGRRDRLAIDALLAVVAGDDLPGAVERLKEVRGVVLERKDGRHGRNRTWNDLVERIPEMLDTAIEDLEALAAR